MSEQEQALEWARTVDITLHFGQQVADKARAASGNRQAWDLAIAELRHLATNYEALLNPDLTPGYRAIARYAPEALEQVHDILQERANRRIVKRLARFGVALEVTT